MRKATTRSIVKFIFIHVYLLIIAQAFGPARSIIRLKYIVLFPYKDKIPAPLQSFVVYEYVCHCSVAKYIGQTTCNFATRVAQHQGISERTGARLADPPFSAIREHSRHKHHAINPDSFRIIATAKNKQDLDILEALHIKCKHLSLNTQLETEKLITT